MILQLRVKNFRSIKDEQFFTMLPDKHVKEIHDNITSKDKFNVLKTAILYGKNASGKSNLLNAITILQLMVMSSKDNKFGEKIFTYNPFLLDEKCKNQPVEIGIEFIANDNIRYAYDISFNNEVIVSEKLTFYPKNLPAKLFERNFGESIKYGDYLTGKKRIIEDNLYDNQLFLSKVGTSKLNSLTQVYQFFNKNIFTSIFHESDYDEWIINSVAKRIAEDHSENDSSYKNAIERILRGGDTGISGIVLKETSFEPDYFPDDLDEKEKMAYIERYKFQIRTKHKTFDNGIEVGESEFKLKEESTGTQKLLMIGGLIIDALNSGSILVVDELDKSLHPKLTRALIKLFNNSKTNPNNAQLIFATHDISLLDNEVFRRDQIWFAEKEYQGNSHYYSLSDIEGVRNNIPYDKWYINGRFGATTVIDETELEFNLNQ